MEIIIFIFLILAFFAFKFLKPTIKGYLGEMYVSNILKKLNISEYTVINNIKLNIKGSVSQIDHIVISNYGVFVIETKNYKGWILGYEKSKYWTQVIYKFKRKFYNPILQNKGHIYALNYILKDFRNINYISIVIFSRNATLKIKTYSEVTYTDKLISVIKKYCMKTITENEKNKIIETIYYFNLNDRRKNKTHLLQIDIEKENLNFKQLCPKCNGKMIIRNGMYGKFKGCSNYPNCKHTENY